MLAVVLLAMINLTDLNPEPIGTPAATIGQRLSGTSASPLDLTRGPQPGFGDVQVAPVCTFGTLPLTPNVLGDMSALSRGLAAPACLPGGRFDGWFASPSNQFPFGAFAPVALPAFGVSHTPFAPVMHGAVPGAGVVPLISQPAPASATYHRGFEPAVGPATWNRGEPVAQPGAWHRGLESPASVVPVSHAPGRAAAVRSLR